MKLGFLFKRIFLASLLILVLGSFDLMLHNSLHIPIPELEDMFGDMFLYFGILVWLMYEQLKESYGTLTQSPTLWLIFLLIGAGLSSLTALTDLVDYFYFYTPFAIQRGGFSDYIVFAQFGVLIAAIDIVPCYIAWRTTQVLINKHKG